jgi:hypothetical protein
VAPLSNSFCCGPGDCWNASGDGDRARDGEVTRIGGCLCRALPRLFGEEDVAAEGDANSVLRADDRALSLLLVLDRDRDSPELE